MAPQSNNKGLKEKLVSSSHIYRGRLVNLRVDTVELPDGRVSTREVVEHPGAVGIVALTAKKEVLLIRQFRQAAGEVLLEIPAGTLNKAEAPEECVLRELQEETGYKANHIELLFTSYLAPGYSSEGLMTYLATGLERASGSAAEGSRLDADEFLDVVAIPIKEAVKLIEEGKLKDAKSICGLLLVARRLGI